MIDKKQSRMRRARQTRAKITELKAVRLAVYRSNGHIYAQVIDPTAKVLATASSLEPEVRKQVPNGANVKAAAVVGKRIAAVPGELGLRAGRGFHPVPSRPRNGA